MDSTTSGLAIAALAIAVVILLVVIVVLWRRLAALDRRLAGLTSAGDGRSLESTLHATLDKVGVLSSEVVQLKSRTTMTEAVQKKAVQRTGLVRYNPFEDTGGNQSFALALLDHYGDGFVISSLHARAGTRVYGKAISRGTSETTLSTEESEALRLALAMGAPAGADR